MKTCAYIIALFFLTSCELVVNIDVPYGKDKIVLNTVQMVDSVWTVELTRSNYVLSPIQGTFFPINQAIVTITNPDGSTEQLSDQGKGVYKGASRPERGKTYHVSASAISLDGVEGQMTMPTVVKMIDVKWDSSNVREDSNPYIYIDLPFEVTFNDPPGEKNFYAIELYEIRYQGVYNSDGMPVTDPETGEQVFDSVAYQIDAFIKDLAIASNDDLRHQFSDETFDGKTYNAPMTIQVFVGPPNSPDKRQYRLRLVSMSEDYFKYLETKNLAQEIRGDPFAQPMPVFSNMNNGFGIFGGIAVDTWRYER